MSKNLRNLVAQSVVLQLLASNCAKSPQMEEVIPNEATQHRDSRLSFWWMSQKPHPKLIDETESKLTSQSGQVRIANVRRWDLSGDDRADMVEFWSNDGKLLIRAVDVNGDGLPDSVKK
jgi:hypothetical protein